MPKAQPNPRRARQTLLAAVALVACDNHGPAPTKEAAATPAATRAAAPKDVDVDDDGPAPARTVALALHHAATRRGPISLHRLSDGEVVVAGGVLLARAGAEGDLAQETEWVAGLDPAEPGAGWRVRALGGRDDDLWLTAHRDGDDPAHRVYRRREKTWALHEPEPDAPGAYYADYATWPEGHAIALRITAGGEASLVVLDDEGARPGRPRLEVAGLSETPQPTRVAGLVSGELFASVGAGEGAHASGQRSGVLRWGPEDAAGIFAPLPALESRAPRQVTALVESGGQVLIGDGVEIDDEMVPYVARFDGTSWRLLDPPPVHGSVVALAEGAEPTIWAVVDEDGPKDSLWRIHAGGDWDAWERVELAPVQLAAGGWYWDAEAGGWAAEPAAPAALTPSPRALALDAGGQLWLSAQLVAPDGTASPHHVVLRGGAGGGAPLALHDDGQIFAAQQDLRPRRGPRAGDPSCAQVYVQLYAAAGDSPEVGTAELRAGLTGPLAPLLLGEVYSQGERQVGLLLSAADYEAHKTAISGLAGKLRYRPRASCGHPPLLRGWRAGG